MAKKETRKATKSPKKTKVVAKAAEVPATAGRCGGKSCEIQNCKREYRAKGYCGVHYRKWRHGEYGKTRYKICSDRNCHAPCVINRHGLCEEHFQNYYVKGIEQAKAPAPEKPAAKPAAPAAAAG